MPRWGKGKSEVRKDVKKVRKEEKEIKNKIRCQNTFESIAKRKRRKRKKKRKRERKTGKGGQERGLKIDINFGPGIIRRELE